MGQTTDELRSQVEDQRTALSRDLEAVGDRLSPGRMVERRRAAIRERITGVRTAVMGTADTTTTSVRDAAGSVMDTVQHAPAAAGEAIKQHTEGNPLAAGVIAFGAGLLAATLLQPSARERDLAARAEPGLRTAVDELKSGAEQAVSEVKPVAEQAVRELKDEAQQAVESVKDEARSGAESLKEQAGEAAESVKSESSPTGQRPQT